MILLLVVFLLLSRTEAESVPASPVGDGKYVVGCTTTRLVPWYIRASINIDQQVNKMKHVIDHYAKPDCSDDPFIEDRITYRLTKDNYTDNSGLNFGAC